MTAESAAAKPLTNVIVDMNGARRWRHFCVKNIVEDLDVNRRNSGVLVAKCVKCSKLYIDMKTLDEFRRERGGRPSDQRATAI